MQSYCFLMKVKCGERNMVTVGTVSLSSLEIHPQCFASCSNVTLQQAAIKFKLSERLTVTERRVRCVSLHLKYIPDVVHSTLSQHFIVMPHLTTREAYKQRLCSIRSCAQLKFGIPEQKKREMEQATRSLCQEPSYPFFCKVPPIPLLKHNCCCPGPVPLQRQGATFSPIILNIRFYFAVYWSYIMLFISEFKQCVLSNFLVKPVQLYILSLKPDCKNMFNHSEKKKNKKTLHCSKLHPKKKKWLQEHFLFCVFFQKSVTPLRGNIYFPLS